MIGEFKVNLKEFGTWGETMNLELGAWRSSVRLSEYERKKRLTLPLSVFLLLLFSFLSATGATERLVEFLCCVFSVGTSQVTCPEVELWESFSIHRNGPL